MTNKSHLKSLKIIITIFLLITIFFIIINLINHYEGETIDSVQNGVCDLSEYDFSKADVTVVGNNIEFYPEQYLLPDEIKSTETTPFRKTQYATERIVFLLPEEGAYTFIFQIPGLAGKVYINGELVKECGQLGKSVKEVVPDFGRMIIRANSQDKKIELVIWAANFHHKNKKVGIPKLQISASDNNINQIHASFFQSVFIFGGLSMAALFLIGIWICYPSKNHNIWFGLLCLVMAFRSLLTNELFLWIFPQLTYRGAWRAEAITTQLIICFVVLYFESLVKGIFQKTTIGIFIFCGLYAIVTLVFPMYIVTATYRYSYPALGVFLIYSVYRFFKCLWKPELVYMFSIAGAAALFTCAVIDLIYYMDNSSTSDFQLVSATMSESGTMIFALFQIISISIRNMQEIDFVRRVKERLALEKTALEKTNQMKTEFLANISHELKTPLTVMSVCAQSASMLVEGESKEELKESLDNKMKLISSEAERLSLMVGQILTVTQIEENRMKQDLKSCYMDELIAQVVETYFPVLNKNNNRLNIRIAEEIPPVMGDAANLSRVLVNLISNALKHTHEGIITISLRTEQDYVVTEVADNGSGISEAHMAGLFKRFYSYGETGTGLGLYICKHIIEAHQGTIEVLSSLGEGTRVIFRLPGNEAK